MSKGNFRDDLYYRLNVLTIEMIPLKTRKSDIPLLVHHFIKRLNGILNLDIQGVDRKVIDGFMAYSWPGNVRELQNVVERMMNVATGPMLTYDLLPPEIWFNTTKTMYSTDTPRSST